jgi:hypothetical protein
MDLVMSRVIRQSIKNVLLRVNSGQFNVALWRLHGQLG